MMERMNKKAYHAVFITTIVLLIIVVFSLYYNFITPFAEDQYNKMLFEALVRIGGSLIFIYILIRYGYRDMFSFPLNKEILIVSLLAFIVAINNFPISAVSHGRYSISESTTMYYMFAFDSISVGIFEELVFRGIILIELIRVFKKSKIGNFKAIVVSALIFGGIHLINIFFGGGVGPTLLQVGYTFLMGLMWAVVYLKTRNFWIVALLHALYNYFGMIMFKMGSILNRYDIITIAVTSLFAILACVYYFRQYQKMEIIEE